MLQSLLKPGFSCSPPLSIIVSIVHHKKYHGVYRASGERDGAGPSFAAHLESAAGQAEVRDLEERMEARLRDDLEQ